MFRLLVRAQLAFLKVYKLAVSPLIGQHCRYSPTCSLYAMQALEKHGFWRGNLMLLGRLLRCAPWGKGGYDPA